MLVGLAALSSSGVAMMLFYYYLLVARRMYIDAPERRDPVAVPRPLGLAIAVCLIGVVGMGVYPGPWVDLVLRIAATLFS